MGRHSGGKGGGDSMGGGGESGGGRMVVSGEVCIEGHTCNMTLTRHTPRTQISTTFYYIELSS